MNANIKIVMSIGARSAIETNIDPISCVASKYKKYIQIENLSYSSRNRKITNLGSSFYSSSIYRIAQCYNPYSIEKFARDDEEDYIDEEN